MNLVRSSMPPPEGSGRGHEEPACRQKWRQAGFHLLSSGLYRRPWTRTKSVPPPHEAAAGVAGFGAKLAPSPPVGNFTLPRRFRFS
ncbi:hypothetical protein B8V81_4420 [Paenibacillus pasadenensis]|uniref:Uncharacterized protein n=1 Tax=Paenibacillus pasadenensis TaxID=217090 RepID=A0A2N5N6T1_9BACL|nr:hypothetical protein B8V81_4420 [Paenibacillus pasadenensis]